MRDELADTTFVLWAAVGIEPKRMQHPELEGRSKPADFCAKTGGADSATGVRLQRIAAYAPTDGEPSFSVRAAG